MEFKNIFFCFLDEQEIDFEELNKLINENILIGQFFDDKEYQNLNYSNYINKLEKISHIIRSIKIDGNMLKGDLFTINHDGNYLENFLIDNLFIEFRPRYNYSKQLVSFDAVFINDKQTIKKKIRKLQIKKIKNNK